MTSASFYFVLALSVIFSLSAFAGLKKLQPKYVDMRSKIDDYIPSLSIGCVATDPSNSSRVYIGTGEGSFNIDAVEGVGVLKSTDAGATWLQTGLNWQLSQGEAVSQMVINPNNASVLIAATRLGVYRTQDGGTSWTRTLAPSSGWMDAKDVVLDPSNPSNVYVAVGFPWGDNNNGVDTSTANA